MLKSIVSYSGGLGSFATVFLAQAAGLDFDVVFADTLIEDEDLHRFNADAERELGFKILTLKDGRDPWAVYEDRKYIGNSRLAHCSQHLKTDVVAGYVKRMRESGYNGRIEILLGMSMWENDRIERAREEWKVLDVEVRSLIAERGWGDADLKALPALFDIALPRLYAMGFPHNNCGGFCVRAGQAQFLTLLQRFPDRYEWHAKRMREAMARNPKLRPFMAVTRNKVKSYVTLDEFRDLVAAGAITVDPFDIGGCGCFVTDKPGGLKDE